MRGKFLAMGVTLVTAVLLLGSLAYAEPAKHGGQGGHPKDMKELFFHKAHLVLMNEQELALSQEQVGSIRTLYAKTKKTSLRQEADTEIVGVDLTAQLMADTVDTERIGELLDQKYALKATHAKMLTKAYAELKQLLSTEQKHQLKNLKREQLRSHMGAKKPHGR